MNNPSIVILFRSNLTPEAGADYQNMNDELQSLVRQIPWFFVSSRRRHTRFSRDWSSDVCSSDLRTVEPLTEVLPNRLLGPAQYRYIPHIYTDAEIQDLLKAATDLHPRGGLRAQSVLTYLGLLACTGMRPREPLRLNRGDRKSGV